MSLIKSNPSKPKRVTRPLNAAPLDLTISAGAVGAGDLLYLTTSAVSALLATTHSGHCVGVCNDTYPVTFTDGVTGSPIPPSDSNIPYVQIYEDGDHLFNTTASESYEPYDTVYIGADARTIKKTQSGSEASVGYVSPDQRPSGGLSSNQISFPITGAAGVQIYIHITPALAK